MLSYQWCKRPHLFGAGKAKQEQPYVQTDTFMCSNGYVYVFRWIHLCVQMDTFMCSNGYICVFKQIHLFVQTDTFNTTQSVLREVCRFITRQENKSRMVPPVSTMGSPSLGSPVLPGTWDSHTAYWKLLIHVGGRRFLLSGGRGYSCSEDRK